MLKLWPTKKEEIFFILVYSKFHQLGFLFKLKVDKNCIWKNVFICNKSKNIDEFNFEPIVVEFIF
jgi:hypothetical protein